MFTQMLHQKKKWTGVVACGVLFFLGAVSLAAPITVPTSLNPGDPYRLAFVSSTKRDATSPDIADYNTFVTNAANGVTELAALGTTWKAIASTPTADARDNTGTLPTFAGGSLGVPIFSLNDTKLVDSNDDLWDRTLDCCGIRWTETGAFLGDLVWTGSTALGEGYVNYELGSLSNMVWMGSSVANGSGWMSLGWGWYLGSSRFYALSETLSVPSQPAIPEPSTLILFLIGIIGTAIYAYRRCKHPV